MRCTSSTRGAAIAATWLNLPPCRGDSTSWLSVRRFAGRAAIGCSARRHMHRDDVMRAAGRLAVAVVAATSLATASAQTQPPGGQRAGGGRGPATPPLLMTTTAWEDGGVIPDKYTQVAGPSAVSPALSWSQAPPGTQSFVLLMHDPEPVLNKGSKMDITHWLI